MEYSIHAIISQQYSSPPPYSSSSLHPSLSLSLSLSLKRKIRTSKISLRTFGTSEKKNNANTPAATPNDAAVSPLSSLLSASQRFCLAQPQNVAIRGARGKGVGLVICTIVLYSWGRFHGCWVGFYSLTALD